MVFLYKQFGDKNIHQLRFVTKWYILTSNLSTKIMEICHQMVYVDKQFYGKVAYLELSSHQISEPKQQAKRENLHLAKISEMRAN